MIDKMLVAAMFFAAPISPAIAQSSTPERSIQVTGTAIVRTAPDVATLGFWLRGEGATADAAATDLVARQKAVLSGLAGLLGAASEITTGNVVLIETRDRACDDNRGLPRLSQGACAVTGHIATMDGNVRTPAVDKAGTAVGLAARLGARDARLTGFQLSNPAEAMSRANAAAIRDARTRAEAVAAGAGVKLGPLLTVRDQAAPSAEIIVSARRSDAPPPPPPPPPPIEIGVKPQPIETRALVFVSYSIQP